MKQSIFLSLCLGTLLANPAFTEATLASSNIFKTKTFDQEYTSTLVGYTNVEEMLQVLRGIDWTKPLAAESDHRKQMMAAFLTGIARRFDVQAVIVFDDRLSVYGIGGFEVQTPLSLLVEELGGLTNERASLVDNEAQTISLSPFYKKGNPVQLWMLTVQTP